MISGSLNNYRAEFAKYVEEMRAKMELRMEKHPDGEITPTTGMKEHLIDEILELFLVSDPDKAYIKSCFLNAEIDTTEAKDVSIMCFGYKLSLENDQLTTEEKPTCLI